MPRISFRKARDAAMKETSSDAKSTTMEALSVGAPLFVHIVKIGVHVASRKAKNIRTACCLSVKPIFSAMLIRKRKGFLRIYVLWKFKAQPRERLKSLLLLSAGLQGAKVLSCIRRA